MFVFGLWPFYIPRVQELKPFLTLKEKYYTEQQICLGLWYLHSEGIVHLNSGMRGKEESRQKVEARCALQQKVKELEEGNTQMTKESMASQAKEDLLECKRK